MKSASRSSVLEKEALAKKLAKIDEELAEVARQKNILDPKKDKKHFPKKIDRSKKPKKSFSHPKLDFVYGEVAFSPYLTKPLDPYPETTFTVVEDLRELKRQGVNKIDKLPKDKQPYDPKKVKKTFIEDVINYEVSFLPKGYEERKRREMELSLSMSCLDVPDFGETEGGGADTTRRERSHSPNFKEKRSQILLANIARGGPAKYMKELKALKETRSNSRVHDMAKAMLSVEEETQMEESRRRMRLDVKKRAQEKEEFRRRAAMEGIESAKRTAERIFERKVPENIRSERASSPPQLLALRRREMEAEKESQRGRGRVSDYLDGAATTGSLSLSAARSTSPVAAVPPPETSTNRRDVSLRPATTQIGTRPTNNTKQGRKEQRQEEGGTEEAEEAVPEVTDAIPSTTKDPVLQTEPVLPAFVVTPMHADDGDGEVETDGNFFNFESFGQVEHEVSPFDDIAPDVATFGSVEDNINVLRESIGIPDEVAEEDGEEGSMSAPTSRPNTGAGGRPGTSGYTDRAGKSNGRGSRNGGPASNVPNTDGYEEDIFPEYNPDDEDAGDRYTPNPEEPAVPDESVMHEVAVRNVAADVNTAVQDLITDESVMHEVAVRNVAADVNTAVQDLTTDETEVLKEAASGSTATEASRILEGESVSESEAVPSVASKSVPEVIAHDVDVEEEAAKEEEALLTAAGESPAKEDQAGMRFEEQSQSLAAG